MTAPVQTPSEVAVEMPRSAGSPPSAEPLINSPAQTGTATGFARRALQEINDNPLQALFGTAIIALLIFNFTITNARIDDTNDRITRLDARFDKLEEDVAEINLKLTALIAALNQTAQVEAALEGRLLDGIQAPSPADAPPG